jgi:hypothetical protein
VAGVQDVPGGDLQGIVLGACNRTVGSHLVAAGDPALARRVLLKRGSDAAAAPPRIDSEGLHVAFPERFTVVHHCGPARLRPDHLDQVAQEAGTRGAVKGAEHVRFLRVREVRCQVPVLGQYPARHGEHLAEACRPGWTSRTCTRGPRSAYLARVCALPGDGEGRLVIALAGWHCRLGAPAWLSRGSGWLAICPTRARIVVSSDANKVLTRQFFQRIGAGDLSAVDELVSDDYV